MMMMMMMMFRRPVSPVSDVVTLKAGYRSSNWNSRWNASVGHFMLDSWMGISFLRLW